MVKLLLVLGCDGQPLGIWDEFEFSKFKGDDPFTLNFEYLEHVYWEAGQKLIHAIGDIRSEIINSCKRSKTIVAEFGQAYWLDKRHGFTPNVTA